MNVGLSVVLYELICRQLQDDGYAEAAQTVARLTHTKIQKDIDRNKLRKILESHKRNERSDAKIDMELNTKDIEDTEMAADGAKVGSKVSFPAYASKFQATHKMACRTAGFSADGTVCATGSLDGTIKVFDIVKMVAHTARSERERERDREREDHSGSRPVLRTYFDHTNAVNDLDFHPTQPLIVSASKDCTIRFYDYVTKTLKSRCSKQIEETHSARSVSFHPSGDYILVGTDHPVIRLYDVNTFTAFSSADFDHHSGAVNMVRWSTNGNMYASASKDGCVKLWDGVTNKVIRSMPDAHTNAVEVTCVQFSLNGKYLLTAGKDSTARLWNIGSGKQEMCYGKSAKSRMHVHACFSFSNDWVFLTDDSSASVAAFDTKTGESVKRLASHIKPIRWLSASPSEDAFFTCAEDSRGRYWTAS